MSFDPKAHMIDLKGKDYLPVAWRIVWFREDHPNGAIRTECVNVNPPLFKATILDQDGRLLSDGHASATLPQGGRAVWSGREFEKAETAAIGRALAHAGYGTQFDAEDEGEYLADSPVEKSSAQAVTGPKLVKGDPPNALPSARVELVKAIAKHFNITTKLAIKRLKELESAGRLAVNTSDDDVKRLLIKLADEKRAAEIAPEGAEISTPDPKAG